MRLFPLEKCHELFNNIHNHFTKCCSINEFFSVNCSELIGREETHEAAGG